MCEQTIAPETPLYVSPGMEWNAGQRLGPTSARCPIGGADGVCVVSIEGRKAAMRPYEIDQM